MEEKVEQAINMLEAAGFEGYLVGGCVRDYFLGKEATDIDITTNANPDEVFRVFQDYNTVDTGLQHGTITVIMDHCPIEITTYRAASNLQDDLSHRDFTMNAMACLPGSEKPIDPFHGKRDLDQKIIRCIGDPIDRIEEDGLRILRALRFASVLCFEIDPDTERAIFARRELLHTISAERIWAEIRKLLVGKDAKRILMDYIDILAVVIPELLPMKGFIQNNPYHKYDVLEHTAVMLENTPAIVHMRAAALFHDIGKPQTYTEDSRGIGHFYSHNNVGAEISREVLNRLKVDNATKKQILTLVKYHDADIQPTKKAIRRWLRKLGLENMNDLILLRKADNLAQNLTYSNEQKKLSQLQHLVEEVVAAEECFSLKDLAVSGQDLIRLGIPEGPEIGKQLNALLEAVMSEEAENTKDCLLRLTEKKKSHL